MAETQTTARRTSAPSARDTSRAEQRTWSQAALSSTAVVAGGVVLGGVTSFGQLLPGTWNWLFNSVGGWSIPVIVLVWAARGGAVRSAITGALTFVALCMGYSLVSTLRGHPDFETTWSVIGLVVGPFLGVAASWLRSRSTVRVCLGAGFLGGLLVGDGVRGLVAVPEGWGSWILFLALGVALLVVTAALRLRRATSILGLLAVAVCVAGAYLVCFLTPLAAAILSR